MKFGETLPSFLAIILTCQGCLSYKWVATAHIDNLSPEPKELQVKKLEGECAANNGVFDPVNSVCKSVLIVTEASADDRVGCYLSFWIYGGWCWFVGPNESDKNTANQMASKMLNSTVKIEYLGRR